MLNLSYIQVLLWCIQDSISQKSVDIQTRTEDQQSVCSVDRISLENQRQRTYSGSSGTYEDGPRARNPASEFVWRCMGKS